MSNRSCEVRTACRRSYWNVRWNLCAARSLPLGRTLLSEDSKWYARLEDLGDNDTAVFEVLKAEKYADCKHGGYSLDVSFQGGWPKLRSSAATLLRWDAFLRQWLLTASLHLCPDPACKWHGRWIGGRSFYAGCWNLAAICFARFPGCQTASCAGHRVDVVQNAQR